MTNDPAASYNVSVDCGEARIHKVGINFLGNMTCPGDSRGRLVYECPSRRERPICAYWNGEAYIQDPMCIVESYTEDQTICICNQSSLEAGDFTRAVGNSRFRRLSSGFITAVTEFTTISATYDSDFNWEWHKNPRAEFVIIPNAFIISLTTLTLLMLILGMLAYLSADQRHEDNLRLDRKKNPPPPIPLKQSFNNLIPLEFNFRPWIIRYYKALKINHSWWLRVPVTSPTFGDNTEYRSTKWFLSIFRILIFIFIDTILAGMYFADDGQCEAYENVFDCLEPASVDFINTLCYWDDFERTCHFSPPTSNFFGLVFITAVISIASVPFDKLCCFMIDRCKELAEDLAIDKMYLRKHMTDRWVDDLADMQTPVGTMFRGSRLRLMQSEIDFVTPLRELENWKGYAETEEFLQGKRDDYLKELHERAQMKADGTLPPLTKEEKRRLAAINDARARTAVIVKDMYYLKSDKDREQYLMQRFIVESLSGVKRSIAQQYFFKNIDSTQPRNRLRLQIACVIGLLITLLLIFSLCFWFAIYIGRKASITWLLAIFISVFEDAFLVQPVKIWVKWIVITAPAVKDINMVLSGFRDRVRYIILRKGGLIRTSHHDVQHLNPAVRACRYFPSLPVSRALMSLNDWDINEGWNIKKKTGVDQLFGWMGWVVGVFTLFPFIIQDLFVELVISSCFHLSVVGIYLTIRESVYLFFGIILCMIGLWLLTELYNWNRRRRMAMRIKPHDEDEKSSSSDDDDDMKAKYKIAKKKKPGTKPKKVTAKEKEIFELDVYALLPPVVKPKAKPPPPLKETVKEKNAIIHSDPMFEGTMDSVNSVPAAVVGVGKYKSLVVRKHTHTQREKRFRVPRNPFNGPEYKPFQEQLIDPNLTSLRELSDIMVEDILDYYRERADLTVLATLSPPFQGGQDPTLDKLSTPDSDDGWSSVGSRGATRYSRLLQLANRRLEDLRTMYYEGRYYGNINNSELIQQQASGNQQNSRPSTATTVAASKDTASARSSPQTIHSTVGVGDDYDDYDDAEPAHLTVNLRRAHRKRSQVAKSVDPTFQHSSFNLPARTLESYIMDHDDIPVAETFVASEDCEHDASTLGADDQTLQESARTLDHDDIPAAETFVASEDREYDASTLGADGQTLHESVARMRTDEYRSDV